MTPETTQPPKVKPDQSPDSERSPNSQSNLSHQNSTDSPLAFLWLILGLIALSSTAIFIKLSIQEISAEATVFNRLWIATLAFTGLNWLRIVNTKTPGTEPDQSGQADDSVKAPPTPPWSWETIGLLLALGFVHLIGRYLWTWSLTSTTAANGAMLANMPPLFTALGGWLFFGQRFDRRFLLGLAIAVVGAITLALGDWIHPKELLFGTGALLGDGAALLSSVFYAASFLLVEKLRRHLSTSDILVWRCALGLMLAAPLVWLMDDTIFPISALGWIAVIGLALISEVTGHGLIVYSLKYFSSAFVTLVLLLEPAPVAAVAWIWFGEFLDPLNIAGFCLITVGIYLAKTGTGSTGGGNTPQSSDQDSPNQNLLKLEPSGISGES